jgi:hypothetical protein
MATRSSFIIPIAAGIAIIGILAVVVIATNPWGTTTSCPSPPSQFSKDIGFTFEQIVKQNGGDTPGLIAKFGVATQDVLHQYPNADKSIVALGLVSVACNIIFGDTGLRPSEKNKLFNDTRKDILRLMGLAVGADQYFPYQASSSKIIIRKSQDAFNVKATMFTIVTITGNHHINVCKQGQDCIQDEVGFYGHVCAPTSFSVEDDTQLVTFYRERDQKLIDFMNTKAKDLIIDGRYYAIRLSDLHEYQAYLYHVLWFQFENSYGNVISRYFLVNTKLLWDIESLNRYDDDNADYVITHNVFMPITQGDFDSHNESFKKSKARLGDINCPISNLEKA